MARNLRRSRRSGTSSKSTSAYSVNDIVEINRGNARVKARLAQLLTDASSSNPCWLIKFEGLSLKDEEVYEDSFAKSSSSDTDSDSGTDSYSFRRSSRGPYGISSDNETGDDHRHSRLRRHHPHSQHQHHHHSSNLPSEESETVATKRSLAREARSKKRQAHIDETKATAPNKRLCRRIAAPPLPPNHPSRRNSKGKRSNSHHKSLVAAADDDEEDVVKVKLLTGTLYLVKGLHRRAEFVRRV